MRARRPTICKGFTLLEMLVVLVITALISTLLLQGLGQALHLREGFAMQLTDMEQGALQEYWFRSSVQGLMPDYPATVHPDFFQAAEPQVFSGDARAFSGLSLAALDADSGVPMPFGWRLQSAPAGTALQYRTGTGEYWDVLSWPGDTGAFSYMDKDGRQHAQWPPGGGPAEFSQLPLMIGNELIPQLPRAIVLSGLHRQQPFIWFAAIAGRDTPPLDYRLMD